ncbi:MAG: IS4 family transposase [Balneolaceae bacterium]|nr:IS4 family transposase [Balneolaceae bacterium]
MGEHPPNRQHAKGITSWTHLVTMLFCQFSKLNSLRDVCNGLKSASGNLNHLGVGRAPCKSSLPYQNKHRDWRLFKAYYFKMLGKLSAMAKFRQTRFKIKSKILLPDSTTISLCLSLYDWARFRKKKGAIKLHTLLDYDGCLPVYMNMTEGKVHDGKAVRELSLPKDAVVVADRAYVDFTTLWRWHQGGSYFVVRLKDSIKFHRLEEKPLPEGRHEHILLDEYIELSASKTRAKYPKKLRRVVVYDPEQDRTIELITNHFYWTANTVGELYKARWEIEIFFKEIKQLLKIKSFLGTSANAVLIQIPAAMIAILVLKYLRACATYAWCLSNMVAFLRLNLFVKFDLESCQTPHLSHRGGA